MRRLSAGGALLLVIAAIVLAIVAAIRAFPSGLAVLACLALAVLAAWNAVQRRGTPRLVLAGAAALLLGGAVAIVVVQGELLLNLLVAAALAGSFAAARSAFRVHVRLPAATRPEHPVLFYNPLSGGGKATRFHLADEAERRGIEPVELRRGDDLEELVQAAVARGADGLAMAGGDGSQAIVAKLAARAGLPYACIPAGTRNHFALDLGVDREDVVGALDAFVTGGERLVDLAEVNGRVFVNNVSLGLYAEAVQQAGYRNAKIRTLLDAVPDSVGPDAAAPRLRWTGSDGPETAVALLVSNNAYRLGRAVGSGTRPRLDRGLLGIAAFGAMEAREDRSDARPLLLRQWTTEAFEVGSDASIPAGIDGEAAVLDSPLEFRVLPAALRVRVALDHPGASPSALMPATTGELFRTLLRFAFGPSSDRELLGGA